MSNKSKSHQKKNRRYIPGRKTIKFHAHDAGIIFRGKTGDVKFFMPTAAQKEQPMGGPAFWVNFLRWLFEAGDDANERRDTFVNEFMMDMEERGLRRAAENRVIDSHTEDGITLEVTDEKREELVLEAMEQIKDEIAEAKKPVVTERDPSEGYTIEGVESPAPEKESVSDSQLKLPAEGVA